ncbi:MAG: hypothetical protein D6795_07570, partial [Deltaproteobacteria bacterium]
MKRQTGKREKMEMERAMRIWGRRDRQARFMVGLALLSFLYGALPAAAKGKAEAWHVESPWIIDPAGRVAIFHGVNMMNKQAPYLPSIGDADIERVAGWGMNIVRFGIFWAALEPEAGAFNEAYLAEVERFLDRFHAAGLFVLLDMHQDVYGEKYGGDGAPVWAAIDDGLPFRPKPFWGLDYFTRAVIRAFDNFWDDVPGPDGVGLQEHFARNWRRVAERFRDHPALLGYDLFNEPYFGSHGFVTGKFERRYLQPFYERAIREIREVDDRNVVFYEPKITKDFGTRSQIGPMPFEKLGCAFH